MPYSKKQNKLFRAIEHGWHPPASSKINISQADAAKMAAEGVKGESEVERHAKAHRGVMKAAKRARNRYAR